MMKIIVVQLKKNQKYYINKVQNASVFFPINPFNRMIVEMAKKFFLIISCGVGYEISGLFIFY